MALLVIVLVQIQMALILVIALVLPSVEPMCITRMIVLRSIVEL